MGRRLLEPRTLEAIDHWDNKLNEEVKESKSGNFSDLINLVSPGVDYICTLFNNENKTKATFS